MHKSHLQRASAMAETEMEDRVASWHSRAVKAREFMDYLVQLIPPENYLPGDQDAARLAKKAKRRRMDPESEQATTLGLQKEAQGEETGLQWKLGGEEDRPSLQDRLQRRLEELREKRRVKDQKERAKKAKRFAREARKEGNQSQREEGEGFNFNVAREREGERDYSKREKGQEGRGGRMARKRRLLKDAMERVKRVEGGEEAPHEHAWEAAFGRASREKVHDDPSKLKQSLKREKKRKRRSALQWQERARKQEEVRQARQEARRKNLARRKDSRIAKKIAKKEPKRPFPPRPGFEGRASQPLT